MFEKLRCRNCSGTVFGARVPPKKSPDNSPENAPDNSPTLVCVRCGRAASGPATTSPPGPISVPAPTSATNPTDPIAPGDWPTPSIPYVSRRLDIVWVPPSIDAGQVFHLAGRPHYRLTLPVWLWCSAQVEKRFSLDARTIDPQAREAYLAIDRLTELVGVAYTSDQIRAAVNGYNSGVAPQLPVVPAGDYRQDLTRIA